ncbi:MAG: hypothetical protein MJ252_02535 [archaeon]|nr:hypothetical protein [archaeon]
MGLNFARIENPSPIEKLQEDLRKDNKEPPENNKTIQECITEYQNLHIQIMDLQQKFEQISSLKEFADFGFVTLDDLRKLSTTENLDLVVIKAPKGTFVDIIDPQEAKETYESVKDSMDKNVIPMDKALLDTLHKQHHLFLDSPSGKIMIYRITKGEINLVDFGSIDTANGGNQGTTNQNVPMNTEEIGQQIDNINS